MARIHYKTLFSEIERELEEQTEIKQDYRDHNYDIIETE